MILEWAGKGEAGKSTSPTSVPSSLPETSPPAPNQSSLVSSARTASCQFLWEQLSPAWTVYNTLTRVNAFELDRAGAILSLLL